MTQDLATLRKEYTKFSIDIDSVHQNPFVQFETWMNQAIDAQVLEPTAMTLCTVSANGRPSARIVLLKGLADGRLVFYTNYQSRKGHDLETNPACAINLFWPELERQINIQGIAQLTTAEASDAYFHSRPRNSQIGAWASPQSSRIASRTILEERFQRIESRYANTPIIPRPKQWGGYAIEPYEIEFWQGRASRLHDRIVYQRQGEKWSIDRLAP